MPDAVRIPVEAGSEIATGGSDAFGRQVRGEIERWSRVVLHAFATTD